MKRFLMLGLAVMLSMAMLGRAEAVRITGDITFGGTLDVGLNLATTDTVDFNNPAVVTFADGDFAAAGIGIGTLATFLDFQFSPFVANNPLWSIALGGFSFDLGSVSIGTQNATNLTLTGIGTMNGTGFDPTPYRWSFSADRTGQIAFSATNTPIVPEPSSLLLLGAGLLGLAAARRRKA